MKGGFKPTDNLNDIRDVKFSKEMSTDEKKKEFIRQVGSSKVHMVGDVKVECVYGNMKLDKMLADLICENKS